MDDDEAVFTEPVEQVVPVLFSIPNGMLEDYRPVFVRRAYLLPVSVLAAWTPKELAGLARDAGLAAGGRLSTRPCWPWRMLLTWEPTAPAAHAPREVHPASARA